MKYLEEYQSALNPLLPLWPKYGREHYTTDKQCLVSASSIDLARAIQLIDNKVRSSSKGYDYALCAKINNEIIEEMEKVTHAEVVKAKKFSTDKFVPQFQKKQLDMKKLHKQFSLYSKGEKTLHQLLQSERFTCYLYRKVYA